MLIFAKAEVIPSKKAYICSYRNCFMKRILSLSLALLLLSSGMHLTLASHFCGGMLAQAKWSVDNELGTCGMEGEAEHHPQGITLHETCCQDVVSAWSTDGQYQASAMDIKPFAPVVLACLPTPSCSFETMWKPLNCLPVFPPGTLQPTRVTQEDLCIYRI